MPDSTTSKPDPARYPVRLPARFVDEAWRYLTTREKAILPVLQRHLPNIKPGRDRIGERAGLGLRAVSQGLSELEDSGILTRRQQVSGKGFGTNQYDLADLRDKQTLDRILARLKRRQSDRKATGSGGSRAHKPAHGARTDLRTPRAQTRARACAEIRAQSHHQGGSLCKVSLCNLSPTNAAESSQAADTDPQPNSQQTTEGFKKRLNDDDPEASAGADANRSSGPDAETMERLAAEIPDTATSDEITEILKARGVDGGRAATRAQDPRCTPEVVRGVIHRFEQYGAKVRKPGAYIAEGLDEALRTARQVEQQRSQQTAEVRSAVHEWAYQIIDQMSDDELAEAIEASSAPPETTPEHARDYPLIRVMVAQAIATRRFREVGDGTASLPAPAS